LGILNRLRYWRRLKADLSARSAADIPDRLPARHGVIVGTDSHPKWLVFDCPCRRGHRVMLNLDPGHTPRWRVSATTPLTLHPSVDERSPVGHCHYVVREGRVRWIERTDRR
jgi:hypothetical protein